MGCTNSSLKNVHEHNPLTETQIRERIEAPKECKGLTIADMKMRYAWVSQRGYYPDGTSGSCIIQDPVRILIFFVMQPSIRKTKTHSPVYRSSVAQDALIKRFSVSLMGMAATGTTVRATRGTT
jgi:hypothetical protein